MKKITIRKKVKINNSYSGYIWVGITVLLSVAIIFVCNLLPVSLFNSSTNNYTASINRNLNMSSMPDFSDLNSEKFTPEYYSIYTMQGRPVSKDEVEIKKSSSSQTSFSYQLVFNFLSNVFYIPYDDTSEINCEFWDVYKDNVLIDNIMSINSPFRDVNNNFWDITIYGNDQIIMYASRTAKTVNEVSSLSASYKDYTEADLKQRYKEISYSKIFNCRSHFGLYDESYFPDMERDDALDHTTTFMEYNDRGAVCRIKFFHFKMRFDITLSLDGTLLEIRRVDLTD